MLVPIAHPPPCRNAFASTTLSSLTFCCLQSLQARKLGKAAELYYCDWPGRESTIQVCDMITELQLYRLLIRVLLSRYPFLSCEIIACEIPQIVDTIVLERKELLESFWSFLDRPAPPRRSAAAAAATDDDQAQAQRKEHQEEAEEQDKPVGLDSLQAQYFCKTISVFLTKRTAEVSKRAWTHWHHTSQETGEISDPTIFRSA